MERRLAAILAADVVDYSRMIRADEYRTLKSMRTLLQELIEPKIEQHRGRIFKLMGDGLLVEFSSAVDAVTCAMEIQQDLAEKSANEPDAERLVFRIGINLGDVVVDGNDIHGDGVNVAARLEALSEPGGICISEAVHEQVRDRLDLRFDNFGQQSVKNIDRPIQTWKWSADNGEQVASATSVDTSLSLPDKPSIAVLPFTNLSGDPDQEYFADGMVEEITTALSRMRWLFVIARNSTFTLKGKAVDVTQVGRQFGVRYVLEGSVRRSGNRVRITGQLIDATTNTHLWADHFDGSLEDVFDLQDNITASVVGAIAPRMEHAEIDRAKRKKTENLDAYDYYLRGLAAVYQWNREANEQALTRFSKAVELDPTFASAYGMAARCYSMRKACGWVADAENETAKTTVLARNAIRLGRDDSIALSTAGIGLAFVVGELEEGDELIERALKLDPNLASAWLFSGWVKIYMGEPEIALERVDRARRLSPNEPSVFGMEAAISLANFFAGRPAEALEWARKAMRTQTHRVLTTSVAAASAALVGEKQQAKDAVDRLLQIDPNVRATVMKAYWPVRRSEDIERWEEGLRLAGLRE